MFQIQFSRIKMKKGIYTCGRLKTRSNVMKERYRVGFFRNKSQSNHKGILTNAIAANTPSGLVSKASNQCPSKKETTDRVVPHDGQG